MKLPDGMHQGDFMRVETEPVQLHFVKALDSGRFNRFVLVAPSQRGKTTIAILMTWLYSVAEESTSVGYIMPNLDKLAQNWEGKIKPAIIGSGFGSWLPTKGPGSKGGRPAALAMTNPVNGKTVVSYFMAGGTGSRETSLSSVSPARVMIDEVDDFEDAGQVELALKRLEHWGRKGKAFLASTVNSRGERDSHPILDFFYRSDATQCRIAHKCQHCGWFQVPRFDQLDLESSRIACAHCGVRWTDDDRFAALDQSELSYGADGIHNGVIVPCTEKREYFSLLTTCFDYNMGDFSSIASTYVVARDKEKLGDYSMMENFSHKVLCEPYTIPVDHETITDRALALRSASAKHHKGIVPDEAERIVVGIDVQGDRCYWVAVASGSRDRRWIIDYDEWFWHAKDPVTGRPVEPTDEDRHAVLERVVFKAREGWPRENGAVIAGSLVAIDIGFNPGGSIGRFVFGKAGIVAVRGDHEGRVVAETLQGKVSANLGKHNSTLVADHGFYEVRKQEFQAGQPGTWWFVKSQNMREHVCARLRLPFDSDGSMMIPRGIAEKDYLIQHLSAWAIVRDADSKAVKWMQVRKRDDYADATNYAVALLSAQRRSHPTGGNVGSIKAR
jgi:phage terminase large subunit GpA-like protein